MQLEVDAEHRHRRSGEGHQDQVHAKGHQAAHALHGDAGQTHGVDAADGLGAGPEALEADLDIRVFAGVEVQGHACAAELANDRSHRRAGGAGQRLPAVAEDEDGVQNDVHHGTHQLTDHAQLGAPGGGQQLFAHGLGKQAQAEDAAHRQIPDALEGNGVVTGLGVEVRLDAGQADDQEHQKAARRQKDAVFCCGVGPFLVLFAQALAQHGIDAYAGTYAYGDHHILQGKGQGYGRESLLTDPGHEHRVYHVVQRLHQHRDHHGHTELYQQGVDLHGTHNVFPFHHGGSLGSIVFHVFSF